MKKIAAGILMILGLILAIGYPDPVVAPQDRVESPPIKIEKIEKTEIDHPKIEEDKTVEPKKEIESKPTEHHHSDDEEGC